RLRRVRVRSAWRKLRVRFRGLRAARGASPLIGKILIEHVPAAVDFDLMHQADFIRREHLVNPLETERTALPTLPPQCVGACRLAHGSRNGIVAGAPCVARKLSRWSGMKNTGEKGARRSSGCC